jgi:dCTP deaminase
MILSDRDIKYWMEKGQIGLENYNDLQDQIQPASVDVHLGKGMIEFASSYNRPRVVKQWELTGESYEIWPRNFYLGTTQERIKIGNRIGARIEGKSSLGRKGIIVHCTAGWIDPGFEGEITLELFSVMPCIQILKPGEKIAQICFFLLSSEVERPYGPDRGSKYQGQRGATPAR